MHFLPPAIEAYAQSHSEDEPVLLAQLRRDTHLQHIQPRMLSGHFQGRLLSLISKIVRPKTILEIGTYTGYSALCLAEGLAQDGVLHTIEVNPELRKIQEKYISLSDYQDRIVLHTADALTLIPQLDLEIDLVFIDAEKKNYTAYLEAVLPKMKSGGVLLVDNVLWTGKVVEPLDPKDKTTEALLSFNQYMKNHARLSTVLMPLRDGLTLSLVK
ncbi:MAG: O-methyltransferase [Flavobacteriaceae bacterium]|jgi:caffeoyl-CoA O-methyltransferase|nr:O-methyltransferase [Flavobacteriaceae bacterium]MDP4754869.1 O-methyltransferase [Flavobacteriaceae bacterium]MDP4795001.1 O-methyltransferase [Flavobacteriaceae bacterium]MDP4884902.1 O-methyltransferase [Flavobacteriaceae bacterium]